MHNPITLFAVAKLICEERQRNRLEEAKIDQMLKASKTSGPQLRDRLFMHIGGLLISAGFKLQEQAKPLIHPHLETANEFAD